ncbi:hypothetical protein NBC2815_03347 [Xanthomonas fragariae]|nr:hypothetical protein [Xanthomonas fragariae]SMQ96667.1 hypothetical protein NBC2815_03347 [Xanthomonas fragariae]
MPLLAYFFLDPHPLAQQLLFNLYTGVPPANAGMWLDDFCQRLTRRNTLPLTDYHSNNNSRNRSRHRCDAAIGH